MRLKLAAILVMFVTVGVQAQSALNEMVKTEQAFSKMAEEKNTRDAFLAFIADDGLLFRPGAVNGKKWMLEHPGPPPENPAKRPLLAWQPAFAGMAASGDMGFTTGPWEAKADIKDDKPSGYGHFVTVWKKQADGSWKFVVDLGIGHTQSGGPQTLWTPAPMKETPFKPVDQAKERASLVDLDRKYTFTFAAPDVRLYRDGNLPYVGIEAATAALAKPKGQFTWQPIGGDVSRAGDLGYTHGTYEVTDDAKKVIERGSYVHIWKKQNGKWMVAMDVINVHPQN